VVAGQKSTMRLTSYHSLVISWERKRDRVCPSKTTINTKVIGFLRAR
jgi:hypothetical protein